MLVVIAVNTDNYTVDGNNFSFFSDGKIFANLFLEGNLDFLKNMPPVSLNSECESRYTVKSDKRKVVDIFLMG